MAESLEKRINCMKQLTSSYTNLLSVYNTLANIDVQEDYFDQIKDVVAYLDLFTETIAGEEMTFSSVTDVIQDSIAELINDGTSLSDCSIKYLRDGAVIMRLMAGILRNEGRYVYVEPGPGATNLLYEYSDILNEASSTLANELNNLERIKDH